MHVKGPLLVNGSGTCQQNLQLTSATPRVNGTIAHGNALEHVILCLFIYHDIPLYAIPYTMRCQLGHTIYHAVPTRPYHTPFITHQAIPYTMPCPPGHTIYYANTMPCMLGHTIYHAMPAKPYYTMRCPQGHTISHVRPYHNTMRCP